MSTWNTLGNNLAMMGWKAKEIVNLKAKDMCFKLKENSLMNPEVRCSGAYVLFKD